MKNAFTLIELIVVIAIILILAAILFPVFQRPRPGGERRAACQRQLKQIGLGFLQYVQDYDERFPPARVALSKGWVDVLQPYIKSTQIFQCPSGPRHAKSTTDYFYNRNFVRLNSEKILHPAVVILGGDGADDAPYWNSITGLPATWATAYPAPSVRHIDWANYLFADGHVKAKAPAEIKTTWPIEGRDVTFSIG